MGTADATVLRSSDSASKPTSEFPLYLMSIEATDKKHKILMPLQEAGVTYNNGYFKIEIVGLVLEKDDKGYFVRDITEDERQQIVDIADECDARK